MLRLSNRLNQRVAIVLFGMVAAIAAATGPVRAGSSWQGVKTEVYGSRPIEDGTGLISLKTPYRPDDVRAVPVSIDAALPAGGTIKGVNIFVDENPSPLAAAFKVGGTRSRMALATKVRLNQESFIRAVVDSTWCRRWSSSQADNQPARRRRQEIRSRSRPTWARPNSPPYRPQRPCRKRARRCASTSATRTIPAWHSTR